jgi:hypothetical protein
MIIFTHTMCYFKDDIRFKVLFILVKILEVLNVLFRCLKASPVANMPFK